MVSNIARNPNILRIGAIVGAIVTVVMLLLVWWQVPPEEQIICYIEKSMYIELFTS